MRELIGMRLGRRDIVKMKSNRSFIAVINSELDEEKMVNGHVVNDTSKGSCAEVLGYASRAVERRE